MSYDLPRPTRDIIDQLRRDVAELQKQMRTKGSPYLPGRDFSVQETPTPQDGQLALDFVGMPTENPPTGGIESPRIGSVHKPKYGYGSEWFNFVNPTVYLNGSIAFDNYLYSTSWGHFDGPTVDNIVYPEVFGVDTDGITILQSGVYLFIGSYAFYNIFDPCELYFGFGNDSAFLNMTADNLTGVDGTFSSPSGQVVSWVLATSDVGTGPYAGSVYYDEPGTGPPLTNPAAGVHYSGIVMQINPNPEDTF